MTDAASPILLDIDDGVATITFNRPAGQELPQR